VADDRELIQSGDRYAVALCGVTQGTRDLVHEPWIRLHRKGNIQVSRALTLRDDGGAVAGASLLVTEAGRWMTARPRARSMDTAFPSASGWKAICSTPWRGVESPGRAEAAVTDLIMFQVLVPLEVGNDQMQNLLVAMCYVKRSNDAWLLRPNGQSDLPPRPAGKIQRRHAGERTICGTGATDRFSSAAFHRLGGVLAGKLSLPVLEDVISRTSQCRW